jgi:hypothetical protein
LRITAVGNAGIESRFDRDLHRQSGGKVLQNLMIFSSVSLLLRIVCLLSGEQNPDLKSLENKTLT